MEYLNIKQAAAYNKSIVQCIYSAIRRGSLKAKKIPIKNINPFCPIRKFEIVTTKEWLDEWAYRKKQKTFQRFNGKEMYDQEKGQMNSQQVMDLLGLTKGAFFNYVYTGRIKFTRKGTYYIFHKEDVENLRSYIFGNAAEKAA